MSSPSTRRAALLPVALLALSGCRADDSTAPAAPSVIPAGTHQSALVSADVSPGHGGVSVTPAANAGGFFDATIRVRVAGAKPNTTYIVQRAPEIGRTAGSDGVCQRALGIAPWSSADAAAASFLTFTLPGGTTPVTLTTSAMGDATVEFSFQAPAIPAGTRFDVMFRLLDDLATPTSLYFSGCFTVTVL